MRSRVVSLLALVFTYGCAADPVATDSTPAPAASSDAGVSGDGGAPGLGDAADGSAASPGDAASSPAPATLLFGAYKDVGISMNWNTNVFATAVGGASQDLGAAVAKHGGKLVTLAFATGECGAETWAGLSGTTAATANVKLLEQSKVSFIVSTGGAAGQFTCASETGMDQFLTRWSSPSLAGVDFDIEAGQTPAQIDSLVQQVVKAHAKHPSLRFSFTLATLATSASGSTTAASLGASAPDTFNVLGDEVMASLKKAIGNPSAFPTWLTVNLMVMDFGGASASNCVVANGACDMGQSALQAAHDVHDHWGVPFANLELTPMIGGNDAVDERFSLTDVDTLGKFAIQKNLAGVHYWSLDRDKDCPTGSASSTCNTMGASYAGAYGFLSRFLATGL